MGILYYTSTNLTNKVKNVVWIVFLSSLLLGALKLINAFCQCGASFHLVEQCLCLHSPALCEETLSRVVFVQQTKQEKQQSNYTSWGIISAFKDKASHPGNPTQSLGITGRRNTLLPGKLPAVPSTAVTPTQSTFTLLPFLPLRRACPLFYCVFLFLTFVSLGITSGCTNPLDPFTLESQHLKTNKSYFLQKRLRVLNLFQME